MAIGAESRIGIACEVPHNSIVRYFQSLFNRTNCRPPPMGVTQGPSAAQTFVVVEFCRARGWSIEDACGTADMPCFSLSITIWALGLASQVRIRGFETHHPLSLVGRLLRACGVDAVRGPGPLMPRSQVRVCIYHRLKAIAALCLHCLSVANLSLELSFLPL